MRQLSAQQQEEAEQYRAWWERARPLFETHDRSRFSGWPIPQHTDTPWSTLKKPLSQARIALLSSAGIYLPPQPRFDDTNHEGDYTWRRISVSADPQDLRIAHTHFDHAAAEEDMNVIYPVQRLQELAAEGIIGELSPSAYIWHGYVTDLARFRDTAAEELAACVADDGADAALVVPV